MAGITIVGSGRYLPGPPVPNDALARVMDTSDAWIRQRTGIATRHYAPDGVGVSDLAVHAARAALEDAGIDGAEVDYVIFATMTPDYPFPGPGALIAARLGLDQVPALDVRQQCCAIPYALQVADGLVATGAARTVLLVGAEAHAGFMPWTEWRALEDPEVVVSTQARERATRHRGLAVLFGDGAGALVLRPHPKPGHGLIGVRVRSDGHGAHQLYVEAGGFRRRPYLQPWMLEEDLHVPRMEGRELFRAAVTRLPALVRELCAAHDVALEQIDWFIAHQANDRINAAVREALGVPEERVPSNIARYGNTSSATIPILVDELRRDGVLREDQLVCFLALGAGLHWGAALMRL